METGMETVINGVKKVKIIATKTTKRKRLTALILSQRSYLTLIFYRAYNMDVENEYPPREFYYPEDLETRNLRD